MSLELNPVFEAPGLQLGPVFDVSGVPTIGIITPTADGCVFTHTGGGTHFRITPLDTGVPRAAQSLPASPVTLTGESANREFRLEVGPNATTWSDSEEWGTLNPGVGGGPVDGTETISGQIGAAEASGLPATITAGTGTNIAAGVGLASASGLAAGITLLGPLTISCAVGSADAVGLRAIIRTLGALPPYAEQPKTASSWSYNRTATLWSFVSRDEWGGQTVHAEPVLFLCDYAADSKRAVTAAGDEFTTRLLVYTSLPGLKQGDMLLIGATAERDPYMAGAHEVRAVTEFGDTFSTDGPPDFRVAT
jgi:hypothetical protein